MELGLNEKTAIVLGASQGIGLAIAEAFAAEGANVAMFARRRDVLEREAKRIGALAVPGDLTSAAHRQQLVSTASETFGSVDVLVLNGGGPPPGPAVGLDAGQIQEAVELLLVPHVHLVDLCLPHLRGSAAGRIVAIQSISVKEPIANLALSNAIRPGVVGWLKTLSRELAPDGITVNTIAPGRIDTERLRALYGPDGPSADALAAIPAGRLGSPAEIAAAALFLASAGASYVTGTTLSVDGGLSHGLV